MELLNKLASGDLDEADLAPICGGYIGKLSLTNGDSNGQAK